MRKFSREEILPNSVLELPVHISSQGFAESGANESPGKVRIHWAHQSGKICPLCNIVRKHSYSHDLLSQVKVRVYSNPSTEVKKKVLTIGRRVVRHPKGEAPRKIPAQESSVETG